MAGLGPYVQRAITLVVLVLLAHSAAAASWRTSARLRLREGPSTFAEVLTTIPARTVIDVSACAESWCIASWGRLSGWVARRYIAPVESEQRRLATGRGYINVDGEWVPSPQHSPTGPPAGASAQCRDGTYSFSRHRRGTCSHHGGVRQWF